MDTNKANDGLLPFLFQLSPSSRLHIHFTDTYTIYPHMHHIHPMTNVYSTTLPLRLARCFKTSLNLHIPPCIIPMLRDVQSSMSMPIDHPHAFLMTREMVFRCVLNIRLISCCSDLGAFSPLQRPSLILNVGSVVSHPYSVMLSMHIRVPSVSTLISLRSGLTWAAFTRAATTKSRMPSMPMPAPVN